MSHGTVHDNNPRNRLGAGIIEIGIHPQVPSASRKYRHKYYKKWKKMSKKNLPRYLPFVFLDADGNVVNQKPYEADTVIDPLPRISVYHLVPENELSTDQKKKYPTIGVYEITPSDYETDPDNPTNHNKIIIGYSKLESYDKPTINSLEDKLNA